MRRTIKKIPSHLQYTRNFVHNHVHHTRTIVTNSLAPQYVLATRQQLNVILPLIAYSPRGVTYCPTLEKKINEVSNSLYDWCNMQVHLAFAQEIPLDVSRASFSTALSTGYGYIAQVTSEMQDVALRSRNPYIKRRGEYYAKVLKDATKIQKVGSTEELLGASEDSEIFALRMEPSSVIACETLEYHKIRTNGPQAAYHSAVECGEAKHIAYLQAMKLLEKKTTPYHRHEIEVLRVCIKVNLWCLNALESGYIKYHPNNAEQFPLDALLQESRKYTGEKFEKDVLLWREPSYDDPNTTWLQKVACAAGAVTRGPFGGKW